MNDHDPENLRATDRKMRTSQATIAMPNGSHQQLGQHTRCNILPHAVAPVCAKPTVDTVACLIDAVFEFSAPRLLPVACPLFCAAQNAISFVFSRFRTLCQKPPGVWYPTSLRKK